MQESIERAGKTYFPRRLKAARNEPSSPTTISMIQRSRPGKNHEVKGAGVTISIKPPWYRSYAPLFVTFLTLLVILVPFSTSGMKNSLGVGRPQVSANLLPAIPQQPSDTKLWDLAASSHSENDHGASIQRFQGGPNPIRRNSDYVAWLDLNALGVDTSERYSFRSTDLLEELFPPKSYRLGSEAFAAPAQGCGGRCIDPHPGQFRWWYGQQNGPWVQVWRQWGDECTHYQWFNPSANIYNPQINWTCCVH